MSGDTFLFLFDNQVINNNGIALDDNGPYTFLYADNNLIDGNNRGISAGNAVLLHNTVTNNLSTQNYSVERGAGIYLNGPRSVLFNNTIQSNAVSSEDYGDNIALRSKEGNQFTLRYNKLGNSNGDLFDIYLDTKYQGIDEDTSSNMSVDAAYNFWESRDTDNLSDHIYDHSDNFLAGTVSYSPVLSSEELQAIEDTQSDLTVPPTLLTPEANAFMPGTLTLNFSWAPVAGATKYLLCTNGHANIPTEAVRIMEVDGQTSAEITYFPFTSYAQKYIYWFVVAGNEKGWSLPSEIRKVYFSIDPYVVSGSVLDENEAPVADVYIKGEGEGVFSSETGTYSLIVRDESAGTGEGGEGYILSLKKRGFSDCYTFPRLKKSFDTFGDLTVISNAAKEQIYAVCGQALDSACGSITGIVVDENDNALSGAEVFVEPASGSIYYLDADNSPDFSLTRTGSSGRFVILNVAPGDYRISANLDGYSFDITDLSGGNFIGPYIRVYQNSITVDALVGSSESESGETDDDGTGSVGDGGGGGGGGCFISTTSGSL
ncbi:MAG TPA: carboxypeptidase-like regulatory domain-containing protein [Deltaproteobacteria bacterium]|nr:carboxypeptidase-like regulatory domain-containing protein [Deltaproteobacteria bacterium]